MSINPFADFRKECEEILRKALSEVYPGLIIGRIPLEPPPSPELGDLGTPICLSLAKTLKENPFAIARKAVGVIDTSAFKLVKSVGVFETGYVNFYLDYERMARLSIGSALENSEYGYVKTDKPLSIIIEHTSANPIHPIHIGAARNPILADSLIRMLKSRGHKVFSHFYVNDMGRQVAILAYGYTKIKAPEMEMKPDHLMGRVYAITNCIISIIGLKKKVEALRGKPEHEDLLKSLLRKLDDWVAVAAELEKRYPKLFNALLDEIKKDEDPETSISSLIRLYEQGDHDTRRLVRKVCERCIQGFEETLKRIGVRFDSWDWESDLLWEGAVPDVLRRLRSTPYVFESEGAFELNVGRAMKDLDLYEALGVSEEIPIPSLTLTRSDGTTLYTTRDIAYSLWKLERADRVINVVGAEQSLAQLQLRVALSILGGSDLAKRQIHFAYGLVKLLGFRMSSRRGRYITFDETIDEAIRRAYDEVSKRSPQLTEEEKTRIAQIVGMGAIKYALVSTEPSKHIIFTWDRVLDFERNSGPFIQYSHARACSILRKAEKMPEKVDYSLLNNPLERELIIKIAKFPDVFDEAVESLRPNMIAEFANELADRFNSFYDSLPVLGAEEELRNARLVLVGAVQRVLSNSLYLLGIEAPSRM